MHNPFSDAPVYYREVTGSTMEDSKSDASRGIIHGTVYRAGFQQRGRGRIKGRIWESEKGQNLIFTVVLKRENLKQELNFLPLIAGVALAGSVGELTGRNFELKWPNDLLYKGCKTAGILCEADSEYFYCGMGINCNQKEFPEVINNSATSLFNIIKEKIILDDLLSLILKHFKLYLESGSLWRSELNEILYKKNEIIEVLQGQAGSSLKIRGKNLGIGEDGQLILEQSEGKLMEIYAGEIEL